MNTNTGQRVQVLRSGITGTVTSAVRDNGYGQRVADVTDERGRTYSINVSHLVADNR